MHVRALAAVLLDAAAKTIEAIPVPEGLKDAPIFADPKGPSLFAQLVERSAGRLSQTDYELLGKGTRGAAYANGNVVLKVTNDESEAEASSIIRDNPDPDGRASRIWDVFELRGRDMTAYAVIQERLAPLGPEDTDWYGYADLWPAWTKQNDYEHMDAQTAKQFLKDCARAKLVDPASETWLAFSEWFLGLSKYLAKNGVKYHDFWHRNLMKRGSDFVAIDFGYSRSVEPDDGFGIDVLAKFQAAAIEDMMRIDQETIQKIWPRIVKVTKKLCGHAPSENQLNAMDGAYARIYPAGPSAVCKITSDAYDAAVANALTYFPQKYAAKVFGVRQMKDTDAYCIVLEALEPADDGYAAIAEDFSNWSRPGGRGGGYLVPRFVSEFLYDMKSSRDKAWGATEAAWFKESTSSLYKAGFVHADPHSGNVMKRKNGEHVWIDFGVGSKGPKAKKSIIEANDG